MLSGFLLSALLWYLIGAYMTLVITGGVETRYARKYYRCIDPLTNEDWKWLSHIALAGPLVIFLLGKEFDLAPAHGDWTLAVARGLYAKIPAKSKNRAKSGVNAA